MERGPGEERYGSDPMAAEEAIDEADAPTGEREAEERVLDEEEPGGAQAVEDRLDDLGVQEGEARQAPSGRPPEGSP